jgi:hypothetical protein
LPKEMKARKMKGAKKEGRKEGIINLYFKNRLKIS